MIMCSSRCSTASEAASRPVGSIAACIASSVSLSHSMSASSALLGSAVKLIESEGETLEALQAAIEPTGREAASEAVEHRLEHMIMRKQEQVDYLLRAQRRS